MPSKNSGDGDGGGGGYQQRGGRGGFRGGWRGRGGRGGGGRGGSSGNSSGAQGEPQVSATLSLSSLHMIFFYFYFLIFGSKVPISHSTVICESGLVVRRQVMGKMFGFRVEKFVWCCAAHVSYGCCDLVATMQPLSSMLFQTQCLYVNKCSIQNFAPSV